MWETVINGDMKRSTFSCAADNSLTQHPRCSFGIISPKATSCLISYINPIPDMSILLPASFQLLYNSALQDYTIQTGTNLVGHPFANELERCESVDSISSLLQETAWRFYKFRRENGRIIKSLKSAVPVLHALSTRSTSTVLREGICLVRPKPVIPISYP